MQTHASGSRHELFESVYGLAAASSAVAVVDVKGQQADNAGSMPNTVSTVVVIESFTPAGLGTALKAEGVGVAKRPAAGDEIVIRQVEVDLEEASSPIMSVGRRYLVFLTPSMLNGEKGAQFYVTGASAGVYSAEGAAFVHGPFEEGDRLPERLTAEDLR